VNYIMHLLFYKFYRLFEEAADDPFIGKDWKASVATGVVTIHFFGAIWLGLSLIGWHFDPSRNGVIGFALVVLVWQYFLYEHRDKWKKSYRSFVRSHVPLDVVPLGLYCYF
jgi:hypothetical protein